MGLLQKLTEFFRSLFASSPADNASRQVIKKIEGELRECAPTLYKNGLIQPEFAEILRILYKSTAPIADILSQTLCSSDLDTSRHFEEQLMLTGFSSDATEALGELKYENRKTAAMQAQNINRYFEHEHHELEKIIKELNTPQFIKIDNTLDKLFQLNDICRYSYITAIRLFDSGFSASESYEPEYQSVPPELIENSLLDFYYVANGMDMTNAVYNALVALCKITNGGTVSDSAAEELKGNCRRIQAILKKSLTKQILICFIRIAKKNQEYVPESASYKGNRRQKYADYLEMRFRTDETRLKGEIQDATISADIHSIFGDKPLIPVNGYSKELDNQLKQSTPCSFLWITPFQLLKNFVKLFYEDHIKQLVNDIVIEGFFSNAQYKSDFSSAVFAINDAMERLTAFETRFARNNDFDESNIASLIRDSHKDASFETTLKALIDKVNKCAKDTIQAETSNVFNLYKKIGDIMVESKKPSSDAIQNLKVLMISSRNRENSNFLEQSFEQWKTFLEIMKNYVIIGTIEKK